MKDVHDRKSIKLGKKPIEYLPDISVGLQVDVKAGMPYIKIYTPSSDWDDMVKLKKMIEQLVKEWK